MKHYTATVIKTGNSYALRVPKEYVDRNRLRPGTKVQLPDPERTGSTLEDLNTVLQAAAGDTKIAAWDSLPDPVAWQRAERAGW